MTTKDDIIWLAGLLEGEGSFGYYKGCATIQCQMTDEDVIRDVAKILGVRPRAPWSPKGGHKVVHSCALVGPYAIGWMFTLWPFLHERRKAQIRDVVSRWRTSKRMPRLGRNITRTATCHPERRWVKQGLCMVCYMKEYHRDPHRKRPSECHPDRPSVGRGLCRTCYQRLYAQERREAKRALA